MKRKHNEQISIGSQYFYSHRTVKKSAFLLLLLILLSFVLQSCASFQPSKSILEEKVDSILVSGFFNSSQAAISIYDLTDDKPIYAHNEKLLLHPASNQKILTTAAALIFLGSDYKFKTEVYYTGLVKDSVCEGNIYFVGGFDPDFTTDDLESLTDKIKSLGINKVKGNIYADVSAMDSLFWGEGWMWDDDPYDFLPYMSPLNINKNNITVVVTPTEPNKPAEVTVYPQTSFVELSNSSVTSDTGKNHLTVTRDWINRNNKIIIGGNINKDSKPDTTKLNVVNPTFYFLQLAKESLLRKGIEVSGTIDTVSLPNEAVKISSYEREIKPIIFEANKNSDNLNAEMLLRALAQKISGKHVSSKHGLRFVDSLITLAGLNPKNYYMADGSGLSRYNLVSADLLSGILKYVYKTHPNIYKELSKSFPLSGFDGSLSNRMRNSMALKKVHGKTGTVKGVSSLSGYIETQKNHTVSFSILIQNYVGSAKHARDIQDKICEMIYQQY
jgi:serine-type D-Ala-D-Ala carboxypeptidase/endopeptidase (penicillin-binding protein 4)